MTPCASLDVTHVEPVGGAAASVQTLHRTARSASGSAQDRTIALSSPGATSTPPCAPRCRVAARTKSSASAALHVQMVPKWVRLSTKGCRRDRWSARRSNSLVPAHREPGAYLQDDVHGRRIDGQRSPERRARPRPVVRCRLLAGQGCTI